MARSMGFYVRIASARSAIIVTNWHLVGDLMKKAGSSVMIAPTRTPDSTPVNREPWVAGFSPVILGARRMVPSLEGGSVFFVLALHTRIAYYTPMDAIQRPQSWRLDYERNRNSS